MGRIYITGDTHGEIDWSKLNTKNFPEQKTLTKEDLLIIAGDFGGVWGGKGSKNDEFVLNWHNSKPYTTLFVDGNHENHAALNEYPVSEWNGGKVHFIKDSVIHLMRGQVYNVNGIKIFTMGGARSHDIAYRKENVSWWPQELPSNEEYEEAMRNLERANFKVDYVVTHDCGTQILSKIYKGQPPDYHVCTMQQFLFRLETTFGLEFKHWYFGHHHGDMEIDDKHTLLYDRIVRIV